MWNLSRSRPRSELLEQAGLPDAGLSDDNSQAAASRSSPLKAPLQPRKLVLTTGEGCPSKERRSSFGLVYHLAHAHFVGDTFELEGIEVTEREGGATGQEVRHRLAAEDLAYRRPVTQPPGYHHRRPEVAAPRLLLKDLSDVHAHANRQSLAPLLRRRLLHRDRAAHRIRRGGEGHHEAVAQPLELTAAMG